MINCGTNFRHHHSTLVPLYHSCDTQSFSGLYHYPSPGETTKRRSMPRFHVWFPRPVASHDHRWNSRSWPRKRCWLFLRRKPNLHVHLICDDRSGASVSHGQERTFAEARLRDGSKCSSRKTKGQKHPESVARQPRPSREWPEAMALWWLW